MRPSAATAHCLHRCFRRCPCGPCQDRERALEESAHERVYEAAASAAVRSIWTPSHSAVPHRLKAVGTTSPMRRSLEMGQ